MKSHFLIPLLHHFSLYPVETEKQRTDTKMNSSLMSSLLILKVFLSHGQSDVHVTLCKLAVWTCESKAMQCEALSAGVLYVSCRITCSSIF
jgi:hypothetical protein